MTNEDRSKPVVPTTAKRGIRKCLSCNKEFKSIGPGHRICNKCSNSKKRNTSLDMPVSKLSVTRSKGDD